MSAIVDLKSHQDFTSGRRKFRKIDVAATYKRHIERTHETRHMEAKEKTQYVSINDSQQEIYTNLHGKTTQLNITERRSYARVLTESMTRNRLNTTDKISIT